MGQPRPLLEYFFQSKVSRVNDNYKVQSVTKQPCFQNSPASLQYSTVLSDTNAYRVSLWEFKFGRNLASSCLRKLFWPAPIPVEWRDPQRRLSDKNHLQQSPTCRPNGIGVSLDKATSLKAWLGDANSTPRDRNVGPALLEVVWRILKEQEQPEVTQRSSRMRQQ